MAFSSCASRHQQPHLEIAMVQRPEGLCKLCAALLFTLAYAEVSTTSTAVTTDVDGETKTSTGLPSTFQCDALTILGHSHAVALKHCSTGTCYATDHISACGCSLACLLGSSLKVGVRCVHLTSSLQSSPDRGTGTQCCAPRISLCSSGSTCFATVQIDTCAWAVCCAALRLQ